VKKRSIKNFEEYFQNFEREEEFHKLEKIRKKIEITTARNFII